MYAEEYAGEEEYESFLKHLIVVLWAGGGACQENCV